LQNKLFQRNKTNSFLVSSIAERNKLEVGDLQPDHGTKAVYCEGRFYLELKSDKTTRLSSFNRKDPGWN
jgi:hypothetical protein